MTTQSIIVYRNPLEAAIWESLSASTYVFPVFMAVLTYIVVIIVTHGVVEKLVRKIVSNWQLRQKILSTTQLIVPVLPALLVFNHFAV